MRSKRHPKVVKRCAICDTEFLIHHYRVSRGEGKYCSIECQHMGLEIPLEERFWANVEKGADCWTWIGFKSTRGYGQITTNKVPEGAHRVSWKIHHGPIPDGLFVLHKCDNPPCVNPSHLFVGTPRENMLDKVRKGRQNREGCVNKNPRRGSSNPSAKLLEGDVSRIRAMIKDRVPQREIAESFGVSRDTIYKISKGVLWSHVVSP